MKPLPSITKLLAGLFTAGLVWAPLPGLAAVDAAAAQALAKKNDCLKCHAADKDKKGPSLKKIASKHKGKADAEDKLLKTMTSTSKVKLDDGTEDDHKPVNTKDPAALKNLAAWILSH